MINKLLSMHNIKYIISVDDCFSSEKREEMESTLFSELCTDITPFEGILTSSNQADTLEEIKALLDIEEDCTSLLHSLVECIDLLSLKACYSLCNKNDTLYFKERTGIIAFLDTLKTDGQIKEYLTFSSTADANQFDVQEAGMNDGAILWLLDRNFLRVGESADAGLVLAENIVRRTNKCDNYIYILSAVDADSEKNEDDIEAEFDELLSSKCSADTHSFIYYINKQRILQKKTKRIAKSFAQGFKRKACFELFRIYTDCLADGLSAANGKIEKIRQKALGYLFGNKIPQNGESHTDFAARLVQIFYNDEYNRAIADSFERIAESKKYFEELCDVAADTIGDEKELLEAVMPYRELELYNKHVNAQHCEITTGDIFEIDGFPYLLVSQACDTYLRSDGCRELKQATLLRIVDSVGEKKYSYSLSCYAGMKKPTVIFRNLKQIPFEILDLCVCNVSGQAMVDVGDIKKYEPALLRYTKNYQLRFHSVVEKLVKIHSNSGLIAAFFEDSNSTPALEVQKAITEMKSTDPALMEYESVGTGLSYRVKRVCRLNELTTIDIIKEYGIMLSRIGHPFDFVDDKR